MPSDGHRAPQGSPQLQIDANENHSQVTPKVNQQPPHDNERHSQQSTSFGSILATQREIGGCCPNAMREAVMRCPHGGNARDLLLMWGFINLLHFFNLGLSTGHHRLSTGLSTGTRKKSPRQSTEGESRAITWHTMEILKRTHKSP